MLILQGKFLIHELAQQAGTTVRTIRYYTDEGLLPQPEMQGKYAYYTRAHLNRLELIRRMKDAYLPLQKIAQLMNSLTDEEVTRRLAETPSSGQQDLFEPDSTGSAPGSGSPALEYIARLMGDSTGSKPKGTAASTSAPQRPAPAPPSPLDTTSAAGGTPPGSESWQRFPLAPGVELHLREPAAADTARRVRQLIVYASKLFNR